MGWGREKGGVLHFLCTLDGDALGEDGRPMETSTLMSVVSLFIIFSTATSINRSPETNQAIVCVLVVCVRARAGVGAVGAVAAALQTHAHAFLFPSDRCYISRRTGGRRLLSFLGA